MSDSAVLARGLTKRHGGILAVDRLDLDIPRGVSLGIAGANGAGKTTLLGMISGMVAPSAGSLLIGGQDVTTHRRAVKSGLGVVPQGMTLDTELPVAANLTTFARYHGITGPAARRRAEELLEFAELTPYRKALVADLSGGMQRRLAIARALVADPELILLDEPTTGLDPESRRRVWDRLSQITGRGATLIVTSHHADEIERLCDEVLVLDHGRVRALGTPHELTARAPRHAGRIGTLEDALVAVARRDRPAAPAERDISPTCRTTAGHRADVPPAAHRARTPRPSLRLAGRIWLRNGVLFSRSYRTTIVPNFFEPVLMLLALGLGLGGYVDKGALRDSFSDYIAPGLLALSAMNGAVFEVTYNIFVRLRLAHSYDAVVTTPVEPVDIGLGEYLWSLTRCTLYSSAFLLIVWSLGYVHSALAVLAPLLLGVLGMVFAGLGMIYTGRVVRINAYSYFYTLFLTPLTLVSGVFFPTRGLPAAARTADWFNPLHHGVEMTRALVTTGRLDTALRNAGWLAVAAAVLAVPAVVSLRRHLEG
jgi:Nod factor-specific ABC transporter NodJ protein